MLNEVSKKEKEQYIFLIDGNFLFEIYLMGSMKNQGLKYGLVFIPELFN